MGIRMWMSGIVNGIRVVWARIGQAIVNYQHLERLRGPWSKSADCYATADGWINYAKRGDAEAAVARLANEHGSGQFSINPDGTFKVSVGEMYVDEGKERKVSQTMRSLGFADSGVADADAVLRPDGGVEVHPGVIHYVPDDPPVEKGRVVGTGFEEMRIPMEVTKGIEVDDDGRGFLEFTMPVNPVPSEVPSGFQMAVHSSVSLEAEMVEKIRRICCVVVSGDKVRMDEVPIGDYAMDVLRTINEAAKFERGDS